MAFLVGKSRKEAMKYKTENWEAVGTSVRDISTGQQVAAATTVAMAKRMVAEHNAIVLLTELDERKNDDEAYKATVIMLLDDFGLRWQK